MKSIYDYLYLSISKLFNEPYILFGLLAALYLLVNAYKNFTKTGISKYKTLSISFLVIISFFIGARLLYGALYIEKILENPHKLFEFKLVNFALYGGLLSAFLTWYSLAKRNNLNFLSITDNMMPYLGISAALVKLGCFFNGCCYGKPTNMPWGIVFNNAGNNPLLEVFGNNPFTNFLFSNNSIPRHPTQIYEVFFAIFASILALVLLRKKVKTGITLAAFIIIYSLGRFISFLFRDFPEATFISNIIRGPVIYGGVIIGCSLLIFKILKENKSGA